MGRAAAEHHVTDAVAYAGQVGALGQSRVDVDDPPGVDVEQLRYELRLRDLPAVSLARWRGEGEAGEGALVAPGVLEALAVEHLARDLVAQPVDDPRAVDLLVGLRDTRVRAED